MSQAHRKHVILPDATRQFLERYQQAHGLPSFSATIEAAAKALQQQELRAAYTQYAQDYAHDPQLQAEAEGWLSLPMQEVPTEEA